MGHYRSEMGFEDEDAREAERKRRTRDKTAEAIMEAIAKDGIAYVLADIVLDPLTASIRYRRHG